MRLPSVLDRSTRLPERLSRTVLVGCLLGIGTLHFVQPKSFDGLIPKSLGNPRAWTYGSGAAEVAGGLLLANRRTRRFGAWWVAALFVAVFPGNVKAVVDGGMDGMPPPLDSPLAAWLRLPLQVPLVLWALRHTRDRSGL